MKIITALLLTLSTAAIAQDDGYAEAMEYLSTTYPTARIQATVQSQTYSNDSLSADMQAFQAAKAAQRAEPKQILYVPKVRIENQKINIENGTYGQ